MHKIIKEERLCTNCRDSGTDPEKKNWPIWLCQRREKDPQVIPSFPHFLSCSSLFFPSLSSSSPPMFFSPSPTKPRHSSCQWVPWSPTRSLHVGIVIFFSKGFISWFFSHSITLFFFSSFSSFFFHFLVKPHAAFAVPPSRYRRHLVAASRNWAMYRWCQGGVPPFAKVLLLPRSLESRIPRVFQPCCLIMSWDGLSWPSFYPSPKKNIVMYTFFFNIYTSFSFGLSLFLF